MKINKESVNHYCKWIADGRPFSFAGFSDAEWYCILGHRAGDKTGLGQVIDYQHGLRLAVVLTERDRDKQFLQAMPKCLWPSLEGPGVPGLNEGEIDYWRGIYHLTAPVYERDKVLDDLARDAGLYPWIREFERHPVCLIGPKELKDTKHFLHWREHVVITSPNLHLEKDGIDRAVESALTFNKGREGSLFLVSAGVSAAVIIDRIHDNVMASKGWCLDMGSVWDAFVGIGGQREWRKNLYADKVRYELWLRDNLHGKEGRGW